MMGNSNQNCNSNNVPTSAFKSLPAACPNQLPSFSTFVKETPPTYSYGVPQQQMPGLCPQYHHQPEEKTHVPAAMKPNNMAHPAFPVTLPMLFQHNQSYSLAQLQHVLAHEKAFPNAQFLTDSFSKSAYLDFARMGHYPLGKKLFACPQCRYITDRKNNLKRHIATMHQECDKMLECCGVVFKNKASLRDHVLIFHSNGYMCRFCGRNFCRKALLKRHLTVHSGQKDYVCSLCDYATSHKSNLERHKKVHERQGQDSDDASQLDCAGGDMNSEANDTNIDVVESALPSLGATSTQGSHEHSSDDDPSNLFIDVVDLVN